MRSTMPVATIIHAVSGALIVGDVGSMRLNSTAPAHRVEEAALPHARPRLRLRAARDRQELRKRGVAEVVPIRGEVTHVDNRAVGALESKYGAGDGDRGSRSAHRMSVLARACRPAVEGWCQEVSHRRVHPVLRWVLQRPQYVHGEDFRSDT